ncbi:MAG: hypothetical protein PHN19_00755 [Patescibacteria group bacterium]|nr:hypothetical protein [Patescibacteria group bacterium]
MKTKKEITIKDLVKLIEKLGTKVERLSVKMDDGFKKNDMRFFSLEKKMIAGFKEQDEKMNTGFKMQDEKINAGFKMQDEKINAGFKMQDEKINAGFKMQDEKINAGFKNQEKSFDQKLDKKISELALMVAKGFSETASKKDLEIVKNDLNLKIANFEESLINKIDSTKGDLILIIRKLDEKIIVLVDFLKGHRILNDMEYEKLCKIKAFSTIKLKS